MFFVLKGLRDYRCADADVMACATRRSRVPLSRRTLLPDEAIVEPCAEFDVSVLRLNPLNPKTPRLFAVS